MNLFAVEDDSFPEGEETGDGCACTDSVFLMEVECGIVSLLCKSCRKSPPLSWGEWPEVFCLVEPVEVKVTWDQPERCTCNMMEQLSCDCSAYLIAKTVEGEA